MRIFNKIFEDPIARLQDYFLNLEQKQIRKAVKTKYKDGELSNCYWTIKTDEENKGLSSDKDEKIVQRFFYSLVGYFLGHRCHVKRNIILTPILFIYTAILFISFALSVDYNQKYLIGGLILFSGVVFLLSSTFFSGIIASIFLPNVAVRQDEINEINDVIKRCIVRDISDDCPNDLKDRKRLLIVDANGESVSGQILANDLEFSAFRNEFNTTKLLFMFTGIAFLFPIFAVLNPLLLVVLYWCGLTLVLIKAKTLLSNLNFITRLLIFTFLYVLIPSFLAGSFFSVDLIPNGDIISSSSGVIFGGIIFLLSIILFTSSPSPLIIRAYLLSKAVKENGTELLIDKLGKSYFVNIEKAKLDQINNAKKDNSPFISLGKSTGLLFERRDPFSPTEKDVELGLTIKDLSMHLFTLGASGTGKTYSVIRPVAKKWVDLNYGGMAVLDSKGVLPKEINEYCSPESDYLLISPDSEPFNPLLNMTADSISDVFGDICGGKDGDPFWTNSARIHIRNMASLLIENDEIINFPKLAKVLASTTEEIIEKVNELKSKHDSNNNYINGIINYWLVEYGLMDEKTKSNINATVRSWIGNVTNHKKLVEWVDTEHNKIDIEDTFTGSKIGLLVDDKLYGKGAEVITAFCLRRLYDYAKRRGDNWEKKGEKPVLLVADEVQSILTSGDVENSAIARSLGLYLVLATQNIDGIYNRLGAEQGEQLLGNFANIIAFNCKSDKSNEFLSHRVGAIYKSEVSMYFGLPDTQTEVNLYANSGTDRMVNNIGVFRRGRILKPRLAYSFGIFDKNLLDASTNSIEQLIDAEKSDEKNKKDIRYPNLGFNLVDLIASNEINTLLAKPRTAIAIFNRANVVRRDVLNFGE